MAGLPREIDELTDSELIEALCQVESGLWPREIDFIESVAGAADRGVLVLTAKQRQWAEDVLKRIRGR